MMRSPRTRFNPKDCDGLRFGATPHVSISMNIVASEYFRQMPDKYADLRRHGLRLAVNRDPPRHPGTFPIRQYLYKLARAQFVFDIAGRNPDDSVAGDTCFNKRFGALNQELWNELHLLLQVQLDERPFTPDIAFEVDVCGAGVS